MRILLSDLVLLYRRWFPLAWRQGQGIRAGLRSALETGTQQTLGERGKAPLCHLADAGLAVAQPLGHLGCGAAETIAQAQERTAAVRQLRQDGVEIVAQ